MLKIRKNSTKKLNFRLIFGSFLITSSNALLVMPHFLLEMKGLMRMYNCGKFHLYSICGCQVIKCEMFLWRCSIHEMPHLGGFLGPNFPKYGPMLLKFLPEVALKVTKSVFEESLKNLNFNRNGRYPKFARFVQLWGQFTLWRWPKLRKIKNWRQKFSHRAIQIHQPQPCSSSPLQMKNRITFCTFWAFFREKRGVVTI